MKELTFQKGNGTEKKYQVLADGKEVYYVSEVLTLPTRKRYYLYQSDGKKLGEIKRKRYSVGYVDLPRLFLKLNAYNEISIVKDMQNFRTSYEIKGEKLALAGAFLGENFDITRGNEKIASVKVTKEQDNYIFTVNVLKENLEVLIVGFVSLLGFVYEHENITFDKAE